MKWAMKRMAAVLMAFAVIVVGIQPVSIAKAANKPTLVLSVDKTSVKAGDIITATLAVEPNSDLVGLELELLYDTTLFTYQNKSATLERVDDMGGEVTGPEPGTFIPEGKVKYVGITLPLKPIKSGGTLCTAKFKANANVAGTQAFSVNFVNASVGLDTTMLTEKDLVIDTSKAKVDITVDLAAISLNQKDLNLERGTTDTLTVRYDPTAAEAGRTAEWSTSDATVATVKDGVVTAVGKGNAVITAKVENKIAECRVHVTIPLQSISLNKTSLTLKKNQTQVLAVTYNPDDTTDEKKVTWSSSESSVATVSQDGKVTALKDGTATIKATVGKYSADCVLTVKEVPLTGITLNKDQATIGKNKTETLSVGFLPEDTTDDRTVTWTSSKPSIATVANGVVTGKATGTTTITAKVGTKTATCKITVNEPLVSLTLAPMSLDLFKGQVSDSIQVTYNPADTTDSKAIVWSSDKEAVATVAQDGKVTGVGAGDAIITATGANGITKSCIAHVKELPIESITLNHTDKEVEQGQTLGLSVTYYPANTTDAKAVVWSSSDKTVASVDAAGTVTAVKGGRAVITATTANGKQAVCNIFVPIHLTGISVNGTESLLRKETKKLLVTYAPENTTDDKKVSFTSSAPEVATVDVNGMITGVKEGTAVITATAATGGFKTQCTVTVTEIHLTGIKILNLDQPILKGETRKIEYQLIPENTTDDVVLNWTSSEESVLVIDKLGNMTGVKDGTAKVSVKANAEGKILEDSGQIQTKEIPLQSISFEHEATPLTVGDTYALKVLFTPANTTDNKTVKWVSTDESVASVNNGMITAIKAGKTIMKASVGKQEISYELTVKEKPILPGGGTDNTNNTDSQKNAPTKQSAVKTGDSTDVISVTFMLMISAGAILLLSRKRKQH